MTNLHYKRILIKLSGEVLSGKKEFGIDYSIVASLAKQIKDIHNEKTEIGIVIGAGNIFRGVSSEDEGMDRVSGDYIGMMGTIMNSVALQNELEKIDGVKISDMGEKFSETPMYWEKIQVPSLQPSCPIIQSIRTADVSKCNWIPEQELSLIHISEPTRLLSSS